MKRIAAVMACLLLVAALFLLRFEADAAMRLNTPTPFVPPAMLLTFFPFHASTPAPSSTPFNPNATPTPTDVAHWHATPTPVRLPQYTNPPSPTEGFHPQYTTPPTGIPGTGQNICSMGLYFRELKPQLTDEWFLFTPIELNKDGIQVYPLIASNAYEAGELTLTIENGQLLAEYHVLNGITVNDEFLTFFPNLSSVTTVDVQMLQGQELPFNQPIDIAATFGQDAKVILYMNNAVSFSDTLPGLKSFNVEAYRPWMWQIVSRLD